MGLARAIGLSYFVYLLTALSLLAVAGLGYLAFLAFVKGILKPGEFASYGLVLATVAGATASFFSPCSFTVFPSFIAFAGPPSEGAPGIRPRSTMQRGAVAALGVVTTALIVGIVIGALGTSIGPSFSMFSNSPNSLVGKGIRIAIGSFVASMGLIHLLGWSHRLPLVGRVAAWATELSSTSRPSLRSAYIYGATYVAVGFG
jgi:hypothetical protein